MSNILKRCAGTLLLIILITAGAGPALSKGEASAFTEIFVREAAISHRFEIQAARIAMERARSREVRNMARMIMTDYIRADSKLEDAVARSALDIDIPHTLDPIHREKLKGLQHADNFDGVYILIQSGHYDQTIKLFENYSKIGDNDEIRRLAYRTLPTLRSYRQKFRQFGSGSG